LTIQLTLNVLPSSGGAAMQGFDAGLSRRPRAVGVRVAVVLLLVLVIGGAWVGAYLWLKGTGHLRPIKRAVAQADYSWPPWMGKGAKKVTYTTEEPASNHVVATAPQDGELRRLQRELEDLRRQLAARPHPTPAAQPKPPAPAAAQPPKTEKRVPMLYVVNTKAPQQSSGERTYTLPAWTYIPAILENVLVSEIEGLFTLKTRRPVWDASGTVLLIPQGQRIGAKALTADLLFGNERIPGFALHTTLNGQSVELGEAPIMDASGTNGLTGEVDNHVWRLVWTSIFLGGLQAGQQMLQTGLGAEHGGAVAANIARQGSSAAQQRLGRAQDTRPTITVFSGEVVQILVPKAIALPAHKPGAF
jgi:hypothetical protein